MRHDRRPYALWLVSLISALAVAPAWGLTDEEIFRDFRFNFINPGARSVGLGGAFISAADDATAAEANPAALHYVSKKEIYISFRASRPNQEVTRPSRTFGSNSPTSTEPYADFSVVSARSDIDSLEYLSFVYPFSAGSVRSSVAFSRQVVLDTDTSLTAGPVGTGLAFSLVDYPLVVDSTGGVPVIQRYTVNNSVAGTLESQLVHYNVAFSFSIGHNFSVGVTGTLAQLGMKTSVLSQTEDPGGFLDSVNPRIDVGGSLSNISTVSLIDDTDEQLTYTVGLHWHPDNIFPSGISPLRMGVVYRKGAELGVEQTIAEIDPATSQAIAIDSFENVLKVPDRWGVGVSYRTPKHWLFSLDYERIQYSDLLESYQTGKNFFTSDLIPDAAFPGVTDPMFTVDDANVVHAGLEYSVESRGRWVTSGRVGYYNAPDNKIRLESIETGDPEWDEIFLDLFRGGETVDHYTVGFSFGKPDIRFQFAGDFSDIGNQLIASGKFRWGKGQR